MGGAAHAGARKGSGVDIHRRGRSCRYGHGQGGGGVVRRRRRGRRPSGAAGGELVGLGHAATIAPVGSYLRRVVRARSRRGRRCRCWDRRGGLRRGRRRGRRGELARLEVEEETLNRVSRNVDGESVAGRGDDVGVDGRRRGRRRRGGEQRRRAGVLLGRLGRSRRWGSGRRRRPPISHAKAKVVRGKSRSSRCRRVRSHGRFRGAAVVGSSLQIGRAG